MVSFLISQMKKIGLAKCQPKMDVSEVGKKMAARRSCLALAGFVTGRTCRNFGANLLPA